MNGCGARVAPPEVRIGLREIAGAIPRTGAVALHAGNPPVPDAGAGAGIHAGQGLGRPRRQGGGASAGHQPPAARRQDRHGLSRLRPADRRGDLRGERRADAGGEAVRSGEGVPARHLRHVVDPRLDPGIHPALVEPGEDGHHRGAEEAVLQPAQGEEQDRRHRGGRAPPGERGEDRPRPQRLGGGRDLDEPPDGRRGRQPQRPGARRRRRARPSGRTGSRTRTPTRRRRSPSATSWRTAASCCSPRWRR